ncbi:class I adenylate-forming enzyme family protein [Streptomyces sp. HSW2009]|uniref:class I adenylate-forming enzyme family protein n=1 Tax=Streptomyces sp. HSW2009 TaxID=3142890 RepID=UPI0032EF6F95
MSRRTMALATAPAEAARRHPGAALYLDRPRDLFPAAGVELSFVDFRDRVDEAAGLLAAAGVAAGGRVVIVKQPNFDVPLLAFACARIGAVPVLVHDAVGTASLGSLARTAEPVAILTDATTEAAGTLDEVPADLAPRWYVGAAGAHGRSLGELTPTALPAPTVPPQDAPELVTHSSGTTGVPKLVVHSVASFAGHAKPQVMIGRVLRVKDPLLMCLSPVHARSMSGMLAILALGVPLGFMVDPAPANAAAMMARVRPGLLETVPNVFIRWEEVAEEKPELFAGVRMFLSSFDAAHPRTINTLLRVAKPKARYLQAYGQSETGPVTVKLHKLGGGCEDGRCVGKPVIGHTKIRIFDEDGTTRLGKETSGAIYARSGGITPSYIGYPDQRQNGWWAMGDYGLISKKGCLHLYDRLVDRGSGVDSLLAAEDHILESVPQLTEAVLIPVDDGLPVPLVCTRGDLPLDPVAWANATKELPPLADPVHCTWDAIPHTATWKVKRLEVARRLAAGELTRLADR